MAALPLLADSHRECCTMKSEDIGAVVALLVFGGFIFLVYIYSLGRKRLKRESLFYRPLPPPKSASKPGRVAPSWMFPAGVAAIVLGVLGCWGSAVGERGAAPEVFAAAVLVSMITNPLVFVGFPLGCYWLYRSARSPVRRVSPPSDEDNPKLTHCPDCGKHVSRLAASCPHCGRPLKDDQ